MILLFWLNFQKKYNNIGEINKLRNNLNFKSQMREQVKYNK
jgi:hypothetical protein